MADAAPALRRPRGYTCDSCGGAQAVGATMSGCRQCDWDLCAPCSRRQADAAPQVASWGALASRPAGERPAAAPQAATRPEAAGAEAPLPPQITERLQWRPIPYQAEGTVPARPVPRPGEAGFRRVPLERAPAGSACGV